MSDTMDMDAAPASGKKATKDDDVDGRSTNQVVAMIRAHAAGDHSTFYSIGLQIAAASARKGHHRAAESLRRMVEYGRGKTREHRGSKALKPELASVLITREPRFGLDRLVLDPDLRRRLDRVVREFASADKLAEHGLKPRRRFLLSGPSGTGKTMTAEAFARELDLPFHTVRLDALITKYMGETGARLSLLFDAMIESHGVYFFDEFDAIATERGNENDIGEARRVLNVLLMAIEGDLGGSVLFAATNHRSLLDRAIFRRFDGDFIYCAPTRDMMRSIISGAIPQFSLDDVDWEAVEATAAGLSHAHASLAAEAAARDAVLDHGGKVSTSLLLTAIAAQREYDATLASLDA